MATGVQKAWSTTAADNANADTNINFAEGQTPASLNNSNRAEMAAVKGWCNQISAAKTTGGSANAQTLTSDAVAAISTAYAAGMIFCVKAGYTNSTTTPTFNVDGVGAKTIKKGGAQAALVAGDITAGGIYWLAYEASGDCFLLLNPDSGPVSSQPLDATLTALAALSWSSGNPVIQFTAADTVSLTLTPSVTSYTASAGSTASAALRKSGDTNTGVYFPADDELAVTVGGANRAHWSTTVFTSSVLMRIAGGGVGFPEYSFVNATDAGLYYIGANNLGLSLAGVKRIDFSTTLIDFSVPARSRLARSAETSGTLTAASANKVLPISAGITINDGVFTADDVVIVYNDSASSITITQDTGMTLRLHGSTTTGNRTLVARGMASIYFLSATEAIVSGDVT